MGKSNSKAERNNDNDNDIEIPMNTNVTDQQTLQATIAEDMTKAKLDIEENKTSINVVHGHLAEVEQHFQAATAELREGFKETNKKVDRLSLKIELAKEDRRKTEAEVKKVQAQIQLESQ